MIANIHILDLLIILGAIQGLIFAIYLWMKPLKNKKASLFLSIFICSFALNSLYFTSESVGLRGHFDVWSFLPFYCSLLIVSSFYFFVYFLVYPHRKFKAIQWLVLIPAILQILYHFVLMIWVLIDREDLLRHSNFVYMMSDIIDITVVVMTVLVLVFIIRMIHQYQHKLLDHFSEIEDFSLNWLKTLIYGMIAIFVLFMIPVLYEVSTDNRMVNIYYPLWISSSLMIYWIGYSTWMRNQKVISLEKDDVSKDKITLSDNTKIYHDRLQSIMIEDKAYLDQDLSLKSLAERLDISSGYLSQIINQYEQKNFFDFVNGHRVDEIKQKITDSTLDHLSLLGIAYESGFKSKSTFNLAFKKLAGMTPTAYKKQINLQKTS